MNAPQSSINHSQIHYLNSHSLRNCFPPIHQRLLLNFSFHFQMMMNHSARSNLLDFADRQCLMLSSVPSIFMRNSHQTTHDGEQQTNSSHTLCVCREFMIAFARMLWKHAVGVVRSISAASARTPPSGL